MLLSLLVLLIIVPFNNSIYWKQSFLCSNQKRYHNFVLSSSAEAITGGRNEVDVFLRPESFSNRNDSADHKASIISERLDHVVSSTLSLFNVSKYGVDLALAEELRDLSDFEEAEKKAKEAIEIALQSKEPNNIYVAYAEGLLGEIFFAKGKYKEAALTYKSALQAYESHYRGSNDPKEVQAVGASQLVCWYLLHSRQFGLAVRAGEQELGAIQRVSGLNSSDAADAMLRLATAHLNNGSLAAAEAFFSRAAEIYEDTYFLHPRHHSEDVTRAYLQALRQVYTGLGHVCYLQGNDSKAEEYYTKVEQSLRFDYFDLAEFASTLQHLAFLKWHRGNVFEAEGLLQEVLAALEVGQVSNGGDGEQRYGPLDYRTVAVKNLLATLHASPEFQQVAASRDKDIDTAF